VQFIVGILNFRAKIKARQRSSKKGEAAASPSRLDRLIFNCRAPPRYGRPRHVSRLALSRHAKFNEFALVQSALND